MKHKHGEAPHFRIPKQNEINAELLEALKGIVACYRTFRNVPKDKQEWTSMDDDTIENAFRVIAKAEGRS